MSGGGQFGAAQGAQAQGDGSLSPMQMLQQYQANPMANQSMLQMPQLPQWNPQPSLGGWTGGGIVGGPAPGMQRAPGMLGLIQMTATPQFKAGIMNIKRRM